MIPDKALSAQDIAQANAALARLHMSTKAKQNDNRRDVLAKILKEINHKHTIDSLDVLNVPRGA